MRFASHGGCNGEEQGEGDRNDLGVEQRERERERERERREMWMVKMVGAFLQM